MRRMMSQWFEDYRLLLEYVDRFDPAESRTVNPLFEQSIAA